MPSHDEPPSRRPTRTDKASYVAAAIALWLAATYGFTGPDPGAPAPAGCASAPG